MRGGRMTIYLPARMLARIRIVRNKLNFSKICTEAIEQAIEDYVGTLEQEAQSLRAKLETLP